MYALLLISKLSAQSARPSHLHSVRDSLDACKKESRQRDIIDVYRKVLKKKPAAEVCEPDRKSGKL
ncbi:MAG: hypothetical protein ACXVPQ_00620, partial [Bacteroidia bacterium]